MNGRDAVLAPVATQRQPEPQISLAILGDWQLRRLLRFHDGKHVLINLMHDRLLLEQPGLIPAPATTG
jgi:hypothetical protein